MKRYQFKLWLKRNLGDNKMFEAECPYCGQKFYGWSKEEVTKKYYEHCKAEHQNGHVKKAGKYVKEALK